MTDEPHDKPTDQTGPPPPPDTPAPPADITAEAPVAPPPPPPPPITPTVPPIDSPTVVGMPPPPLGAPGAHQPPAPGGQVGFAALTPPTGPGGPPSGFTGGPPPGFTGGPPPGYQGGPPPGYAGGPPPGYVGGPPPGYVGGPPPGYVGGPPTAYGGPSPGYVGGPPPGYGAPPPYGYGGPPPSGGGPSLILIGGLALLLVVVVGVGAMFALKLGPFAGPTPTLVARPSSPPITTPLVTAKPLATATAAQTVTPTPGATSTAGASDGPTAPPATVRPSGDVAAQLLAHVPEAIQASCFASPGTAPILALANCSADDSAIVLTYFLYDGQQSMSTAYEGFRLISQIEPDTGSCNDPASWPAEHGYKIGEESVGRWLCTEALGATTIYWTDNRLNILSAATHTTSDYARLVDFWVNESGPYLE